MENIDRFFESYERAVPGWFSDLLITTLILGPILVFFLA